jgi:hypothetical protein
MASTVIRPPLSGGTRVRYRNSRSQEYVGTSKECKYKITTGVPVLWWRDPHDADAEVVAEVKEAWFRYQRLGIRGSGDGKGAQFKASKAARRKLEEKYKLLDDDTRRAKEVALARYDGFCLRVDGSLDYHTDDGDKNACVVM